MGDQASVTPAGAADQVERTFERIVGSSAALESVLDQVEQVASTGSTVLIEGKPAQEKNSSRMPFTTQVSAAGVLSSR